MWSDPIESALATAHTLLDRMKLEDGRSRASSDEIIQAVRSLATAREAREFEKREGRLVTPQDRW